MQHGNNTLIVTVRFNVSLFCSHHLLRCVLNTFCSAQYLKPEATLALEKRLRNSRAKMKVAADGDVDCKTS